MKRAANLCLLVGLVGVETSLLAVIPEKYQTIVDRNAFGLNPPPPPSATVTNVEPPVKINMTGITDFGGELKAYFVIPAKDIKDQKYLGLGEGQREGILEVITISKEDGEARVKNSGVDMVLSIKNNNMSPTPKLAPGVTPVSSPPPANPMGASPVYNPNASAVYQPPGQPAAVPGVPGQQPPPPLPQQQPPQPGQPGQPTEIRQIPTRTLRLPTGGNPGSPQGSVVPQSLNPVVYNNNNNNGNSSQGGNGNGNNGNGGWNTAEGQYLGMLIKNEELARQGYNPPPPPPPPR